MTQHSFQTAGEEWLANSAAGTLSSGKSLTLACQAELQPELANKLAELDTVGGALLETAHGDTLSDNFLPQMMANLHRPENPAPAEESSSNAADDAWMPNALNTYLSETGIAVKWHQAGPGVQRAPLFTSETGERVYLLGAAPGKVMPVHSHAGDEWTLILQGGYQAGGASFSAGDLHAEDSGCEHQPIIDQGETCICLVVDDGPLKFRNPLLKFLQPFFKI